MTETYTVANLSQQLRLHGVTLPGMALLAVCIGVSLYITSLLASNVSVRGIPLDSIIFMISMCAFLLPVKMTSIRPLKWWRRYLEYNVSKKIPITFPEVEYGHASHSSLRITKRDFAGLSAVQQKQVLDLLTDFAGGDGQSLQVFTPSISFATNKLDREFYIISDTRKNVQNNLIEKLQRACLPVSEVDEISLRKLMYSYLSPTHSNTEAIPPLAMAHANDLLTLCAAGFEQHAQYLFIDGKYVRSFFFQALPPQSYFGFLNRLMEIDCNVSLSTFFRRTNMPHLQETIKRNSHLGIGLGTTKSSGFQSLKADLVKVAKGNTEALEIGMYLTLYVDSQEELESDTVVLLRFIESFGGNLSSATVQELDALMTMLPLNRDLIDSRHIVLPLIAQTFVPFA
ncbi:MAG: hypothetical protein P4L53_12325 [Candidatus Obscuribacterales bacterium]|nr:hypothetical protein [Candidatus Obscuribacterales bacterium]